MMPFKLRPWTPDDLESVYQNANNPNITRFMSDGFPNTPEKWKSFIEFAGTNSSILYRAIDIDGKAVGGIGISPNNDIHRKNAELGYWLGETYWGKGIITDAIREIIQLGFAKFDIDRIYARPFETNFASHRVMEKCGFTLEAKLGKAVIKDGELFDEWIYAIRRKN